ncbi:MAG: hypothetical protein KC545_15295, partial [Nitrospira sp.]|nr:hypothetical protein [Nitrospira sp.]
PSADWQLFYQKSLCRFLLKALPFRLFGFAPSSCAVLHPSRLEMAEKICKNKRQRMSAFGLSIACPFPEGS